ncbi:nuclear pore complex protein Nup214 isoform X2 [Lasioglossum baleicum]|uniref:nuclear pore complex protein Nup214 isoform X2 n=1 Tax=Lasioglossum baleicum TaxID=434251 RepID=UPI003FCD45D1
MKTAPDPKDVQEFQFKQSHISQILDGYTSVPIACSLITADKKRGLLYVGQKNKIFVLKPGEDSNPEWKIEVETSIIICKLLLSCDCSYLAVVPQGPFILIYDVQALTRSNLHLLHEIRICTSSGEVFVNDVQWNPTVPGMLCTVASDYTVGSFQIKEEKTIELKALERLNGLDALCAAWSPKGKQIVVGCKNGNIIQLKPDLKVARTIPGPTPYIGEVVSILWISNYQFCAAYLGSEQRINVLIVDAPKGEANAIFTCYEDITYGITDTEGEGMLTTRYYFDHVPEWGIIIAASSNSSEIAVLGSMDGGATWNQWQLIDSGRAQLPLIHTTESYPVGLAVDRSPVRKLPWGADSILPIPVPILHILATSGQLCSFHMVNLTPNCPAINSPPTEIVPTPPQQLQQQYNAIPLDTSLVMNGVITSTPRPKQLESPSERPKPVPTRDIFEKTSLLQHPPEKPLEQKIETANVEVKVEPPKDAHLQKPVKPDTKTTVIKKIVVQEPVQEQKATVEDESRDIRAYIEEHSLFEKELRNRLEAQTWECGTEEECRKLVDTSIVIDHFLRELRETTNSLSSDIAYLKALLLQSFAWVEETKSKNAASIDFPTRNCGDNNKMLDLQKLYYYTQTQLAQASKILDLEWSDHKTQEKSRMKIPHMEFLYQNLILHTKIILQERGKVEQLKKQWKLLTRNNNIFGLNRSLSNLSVTSSKSSVSLPRNAGIIEARCKTIARKTLNFTQGKQIELREYLSSSTPRIIKPVTPSPSQHRLEATLSSLASPNAALAEIKNKVESPVSKQTPIAKQTTAEKPKQQSPLASLNSIVARIAGTKPSQAEKKSSPPVTLATHQISKPNDIVASSPTNTLILNVPSSIKSFPKVDSIPFGTPAQKSEETILQKSMPKESGAKPSKDTVSLSSDSMKVQSNLFNTGTLKDVLSLTEAPSTKVQEMNLNSLKFGLATTPTTPAATKSDAAAAFSFATPNTAAAIAKSTSQTIFRQEQSTIAQTFSFASKPSTPTSSFNLKIPQTATMTPQTQEALNLTGLFTGLQSNNQTSVPSNNLNADAKFNYKSTFGTTPGFQMSLGQMSIGLASGAPAAETVTTSSSVTIEKVASPESKVPTFPSPGQAAPATTTATSLFGDQPVASNVSIFGGMSGSTTPTTSTVASTSSGTGFGGQTPTTIPMSIFGGFKPAPTTGTATIATTSVVVVSSETLPVSSFQMSLPQPTFGETVANLPPVSPVSANSSTTPSTLTFDTATTTSVTSVFGKPSALTMNAQFPSTPPVSSAANTFGKPIISPASIPFGSTTNTSIFGGMPTTSANTSIFSGNNTNSIFGGNTQASPSSSIFGGNASTMNSFSTPPKSLFDNNAQKSGSIFDGTPNTGATSFFGGGAPNAAAGAASPGSTSIFGGSATPMGMEQPALGAQPAFGQAPAFGTKPVFGSAPTFGSTKPIFGDTFGTTAFGASASPPAFGSPPAMGSPTAMDNNMSKVFGTVSGNNTFESLATQPGGLTFSSLAQKSPEPDKPPSFSGGSSFSSWR